MKQKKIKTKAHYFNPRTFITINTNDGQSKVYNSNYVNKTEYLNIPKINYINLHSFNNSNSNTNYYNLGNSQNNNIIANYSRVNYYSVNYNSKQYRHQSRLISNNKNYFVKLNTPKNDFMKNRFKSLNMNYGYLQNHPKSNFNLAEFIVIIQLEKVVLEKYLVFSG